MGKNNKKDPMQFTIKFNSTLPGHKEAADFLNKCGRSKATIIALALNSYLSMTNKVQVMDKLIDKEQFHEKTSVIGDSEIEHSNALDLSEERNNVQPKESEQDERTNESNETDMLNGLSDNDLAAIMDSLSCFESEDDEDE